VRPTTDAIGSLDVSCQEIARALLRLPTCDDTRLSSSAAAVAARLEQLVVAARGRASRSIP